ncbi:hypothetical protein H5T88_00705 [bacterium]|nr:hypothetical protein [bacterium]
MKAVRFLEDYALGKGKKAKAGDIYLVPEPLAYFLEELGIAEPVIMTDYPSDYVQDSTGKKASH